MKSTAAAPGLRAAKSPLPHRMNTAPGPDRAENGTPQGDQWLWHFLTSECPGSPNRHRALHNHAFGDLEPFELDDWFKARTEAADGEEALAPPHPPAPRDSMGLRRFVMAKCPCCGKKNRVDRRKDDAGAEPPEFPCKACASPVPNPWVVREMQPAGETSKTESGEQSPALSNAPFRTDKNGKVTFWLMDLSRAIFPFFHEHEGLRKARLALHERLVAFLSLPLTLLAGGLLAVYYFSMSTPVVSETAREEQPIEYVPAGLEDKVEAARSALVDYFAAQTVEDKLACLLPGVGRHSMEQWLANGKDGEPLTRSNILYSHHHSDFPRQWISFTLTPPGSLREIRAFVSTGGSRPLLHWQSYAQEMENAASRITGEETPGSSELYAGVCRAAELDGKARVALIGLNGNTLCYASLEVPNAGEILNALDYVRPQSATLVFTISPEGEKTVTGWKAWGFEHAKPAVAGTL